MSGRTGKSFKNTIFGIGTQLIILLLNFVNRTFFIEFLKVEYLGCNGLFSNILSMLSLAELGIGAAIVFCLYKPLAQDDVQKVKAYMNAYKKAYTAIGFIVTAAGLGLLPLLPHLVDNTTNISFGELRIIYMFFLGNNVASYFFAYKRSLLSASQNEYINSTNTAIFGIVKNALQILLLILTRSYFVYLVAMVATTLASNISVSIRCNKLFPYLKANKERLSKQENRQLFKYVFAQTSHKVGGIVVYGTDNILLTTMVKNGLYMVGLYSNYAMVINSVKSILSTVFNSLTGSIGNLNAEADIKLRKSVFDEIFFLSAAFYGICSVCIICLVQDFIGVWLGDKYILPFEVMLVLIINFYISGMRTPAQLYNITLGLFWNDRYKPWIEAAVNLIASILLIKWLGMVGVFLGTLVSTVTTSFWIEPFILYKHSFKMKLWDYFGRYALYVAETAAIGGAIYFVSSKLECNNFLEWILKAATVGVVAAGLFLLINIRQSASKKLFARIKRLIKR